MLYSEDERILNGLLHASGVRQNILANNLTNVKTPGFVRQDLDFGMVMRDLKNGSNDFDAMTKKATVEEETIKVTQRYLRIRAASSLTPDFRPRAWYFDFPKLYVTRNDA